MITRQLKQPQYEALCRSLMRKARAEPFDAGYTATMEINGEEYAVKVQPERHCKVATLQALRIRRDGENPRFELITEGALLSSFLEVLVYQGAGR